MDAQQQGTHFFLVTLQAPTGTGFTVVHRGGHFTPSRGATRFDCFNQIHGAVIEAEPHLRDAVILAFCLESNQL